MEVSITKGDLEMLDRIVDIKVIIKKVKCVSFGILFSWNSL